jgi:hypothetical protein
MQVTLVLFLLISSYLIFSRVELRRRACRSWHAITGSLSPVWTGEVSSGRPASPRALYRDAGAMMAMADYAERNASSLDRALIEDLRSNALQLRSIALKALLIRSSSI